MFGVSWYFVFVFPKDQKASYDFNDMDADPKPRDSDPDNWFVIHFFVDFSTSFQAFNKERLGLGDFWGKRFKTKFNILVCVDLRLNNLSWPLSKWITWTPCPDYGGCLSKTFSASVKETIRLLFVNQMKNSILQLFVTSHMSTRICSAICSWVKQDCIGYTKSAPALYFLA